MFTLIGRLLYNNDNFSTFSWLCFFLESKFGSGTAAKGLVDVAHEDYSD